MFNLLFCFFAFIIIFIVNFLINMRKLKILTGKKKKTKNSNKRIEFIEMRYLDINYNIKMDRLLNKKFIIIISIINSFIISLVAYVIFLIPYKLIWQLMIGFVLLMGLIYSIYSILGKILCKKGYNNEYK